MANLIHPTAVVDESVTMGDGNMIGPLAVVRGEVEIGDDNHIGALVAIGGRGEVRNPPGTETRKIVIGSRNRINEFAVIQSGVFEVTTVGDDTFVMSKCHVAHDCVVSSGATLAAGVLLAGHTHVGEGANLGLGAQVHQRTIVGAGAMIGMSSALRVNVPPFAVAVGNPARIAGVNSVGMERAGYGEAEIEAMTAWLSKKVTTEDLPSRVRSVVAGYEKML